MNKAEIDALKKRFDEIEGEHIERWEDAHPEPQPPGVDEVIEDLRAGRCDPNPRQIKKQLDGCFRYGESNFVEAVNTHGHQKWNKEKAEWDRNRAAAQKAISKAKKRFLDRVLFDHESGFLMLEDFSKFEAA